MKGSGGVRLTHEGYLLRVPERGVHDLTDYITEDEKLFLVTHMALAEIDPDVWRLHVGGMVRSPLSLRLDDIRALPRHEVISVHECAGSPLMPTEPKRRVGNVTWSGARLADVLSLCGVAPEAAFVWSEGLEWGEFAGIKDEPFVKDLPLNKALSPEVLLAVAMNGKPLRPERGGPVRLVVPGWYGTNSVKWLGKLTLADRRAPGPYTTRFYNDPTPAGPRPVWGIAPESVLVSPAPDTPLLAGQPVTIEGWAWAEAGVSLVEVSVDGGRRWIAASLAPRRDFGWQHFSLLWSFDAGDHTLLCRCFDAEGIGQPMASARNAVHSMDVHVNPPR
ncbi:molybdopterin-dependent oxidoreductase [Ralstonia solanacearum]|uniref:molybdopterin-dependent oxidoreductase n=1 Tax=Ralstonia solanacearum TaxID=305 RepID=UPI0007C8BF10|nr:molybdopterin-dependent oxidoreductase [Ralstonia solanacearum]MDB0509378.1 molybdopterin-dependent oxidoreductase [Ralstonia solanacearum]MDB0515309.1 molybdopterin-dependent oxidoreductase [Ralstonia solanacearum]OAI76228.1 molybdenum-binding oxidoreductase [Ralstonia solanacearum]QNT25545.1 molybdopterin-dependent oxidoreductase [Ralstonia solanacearum]QNT63187.1 molybdopterin-dependent oxidoreductase [Ralstonia solanacearum]